MKRLLKYLGIVVLIAGAVLGGYFLLQGREASQASTTETYQQVVLATRGDITSSLSVVGELAAVQQADLAFETLSGVTPLATMNVAPGHVVKAGDVLATIDPESYQQAVEQAGSDLAAAEQALADLEKPVTAVAIAQADLAIIQAEYDISDAEAALDELLNPDIEQLKTDVADAKTALAEAQIDLLAAQQTLNDTPSSDSMEKLLDTEGDRAEVYYRLLNETYRDDYYEDRLTMAFNQMMDAKEARIKAEVQPQVDVLNAKISVHKAEQTLASAEEALTDALSGTDSVEEARAKVTLNAGVVALAKAREARGELDEGPDATDLAAAKADVDAKKLALADAEAALAATSLVAPFDGTILQVDANAGDRISSSTTILTIADLTGLEVLASVDETTIKNVTEGQAAQISFDAVPGQTLSGVVGSIPLQGTLQGDVMVYEVPVSLEGAQNLSLMVGMTANVSIATGEAAGALLVPTMALTKSGGLYQVQVLDSTSPDAVPQSVPVQVGLSNGTYTQITAGLNEGDRVVVELSKSDSTTGQNQPGGGGLFDGGIMRMFGGR